MTRVVASVNHRQDQKLPHPSNENSHADYQGVCRFGCTALHTDQKVGFDSFVVELDSTNEQISLQI